MNREDIIRKAEEDEWIEITKFVKLAILEEREACAKVCADWSDYTNGIAPTLAKAIRARGQI